MILPVVFKKGDNYFYLNEKDKMANHETYSIVVGKEAGFIRIATAAYEILRPIDKEIKGAEKVIEDIQQNFPTISYTVYITVLEFLRQVFEKHKAEGAVLLLLDRDKPYDKQEYTIFVPEQQVSGASVKYSIVEELKKNVIPHNMIVAGSIHSHPDFGAFQSGTDSADEETFDGIHVTLGKIKQETPEVDVRVCLAGETYKIELEDAITITPDHTILLNESEEGIIKNVEASLNWNELPEDIIQASLFNIKRMMIRKKEIKVNIPAEWLDKVTSLHQGVTYIGYDGYGWHGYGYGRIQNNRIVSRNPIKEQISFFDDYDLVFDDEFIAHVSKRKVDSKAIANLLSLNSPPIQEIIKLNVNKEVYYD